MGLKSSFHVEKALVAIVDGQKSRRSQVAAALSNFYQVVTYPDAHRALQALRVVQPSVLLVDDEVPPVGGLDFVQVLRRDNSLADLPVLLFLRADDHGAGLQAGAQACLIKPYRRSILVQTISSLVNIGLQGKWEALPDPQRVALKGTIEVFNTISDDIANGEPIGFSTVSKACSPLVEAVNKKDFKAMMAGVKDHDNYSYAHSLRVATLLTLFGNTIGLSAEDQLLLASGGLLHDVGKMTIPHEVLNKPGRLSPDEWVVMRNHVPASIRYLRCCEDLPKPIMVIAEQHHEKLDGSGYPHGLAGSELNQLARMAAIVDVFSALTDRRVYKPPMDPEQALVIMTEQMGKHHLDLYLLGMFREMLLDATVEDTFVEE